MDTYEQPRVNPWVVTVSVMLATFMEILDTTVVNVAIPHISGSLAATNEEGTWVVTSYLVSNAIILPMSGWLASVFGRRNMLLLCVAGFTLTSLWCGMATSLTWLIIFRVLQGLTGGGMQPLAQAILLETFPPKKHGVAMAAFGLGIIIAPILGPTLGGWITDNYSWRWIFYLNIPVGILAILLQRQFVHDPSYIKRTHSVVDFWGIGFLALGLGCLQVVLDTGEREGWYGSQQIRILTFLTVFGLVALVIRELTTRHPVVDLRALKDRSFATGVFLISLVGFVLYASLVLLPLFLQTLLGYPAMQSGLALSPRGVGSMIMMPITGLLVSKFDPRKILFGGLALGAVTMFQLSHLNLNAGYWDIFWPQIWQGMAMACMFIPLASSSMSQIPKEKMGNATSIFNLMRNIGGSFGIALMTTFLSRRTQVHQNLMVEHVSAYSLATQQMLQSFTAYFRQQGADAYTATQRAYGAIYGLLQRQAAMLSFVEAFWVMAVVFVGMIPFLLLLRRPKHLEPAEEPVGEASVDRKLTKRAPEEVLHPVH